MSAKRGPKQRGIPARSRQAAMLYLQGGLTFREVEVACRASAGPNAPICYFEPDQWVIDAIIAASVRRVS